MAGILHLPHFHFPQMRIAWHTERVRDFPGREAPPAVLEHDTKGREELAIFGLCDVGAEGPASLNSVCDLPAREGLEAMSLLTTGGPTPRGRETLADASPYDLLGYLGLLD